MLHLIASRERLSRFLDALCLNLGSLCRCLTATCAALILGATANLANANMGDCRGLLSSTAPYAGGYRHSLVDAESATLDLSRLAPALRTLIQNDRDLIYELQARLEDAKNPYSAAGFLNKDALSGGVSRTALKKLAGFVLLRQLDDGRVIGNRLARLIQSYEDALYVYQHLNEFRASEVKSIFDVLREKNVYFASARKVTLFPYTTLFRSQ
mgnify:CR=1 FL=1